MMEISPSIDLVYGFGDKQIVSFHYINQPPKRYTFEMPKLKQLVES